jgi:drug/metabolite transporter (DMT)-like permease
MVAGVFCMASMDVMAKILGHSIPVAQIVWLRFVSQALLVGGGLIIARRALFTSAHIKLHMLRGLATTFSSYMFFLGIIYLPLADATALIQLGPVMVTLGAVFVLGETIGRRRIVAIAVAFLGAMLIIRPGSSVMSPASAFPMLGAIGFTVYALATRFVRSDGPWTALFLQGVFRHDVFLAACALLLAAHCPSRCSCGGGSRGIWHFGPFAYDPRLRRSPCGRYCALWLCWATFCGDFWALCSLAKHPTASHSSARLLL